MTLNVGRRALLTLTFAAALAPAVAGCGGGGGDATTSADSQAAIEERVARERDEAGQLARQDERIKQLEKDLRAQKSKSSGKSSSTTKSAATPKATPAPTQRTVATPAASTDDWPGGAGHTVVLASLPSESAAREKQASASAAGLDAGVLESSNYRSLKPGYWVVFSGTFTTASGAAERQSRARDAGFSDAYARFVSP